MCGFLGIVCPQDGSTPPAENIMIAMRDTMTRRGPDEAGLWRHKNFAFAHRRLAIRDLESGHQPLVTRDGRFAIVYNGEIYNDAQLRNELEELGHEFHSRCDTEVLLRAWVQWGVNAIERLQGMFSFAVADTVQNRWWLVRDRCGVKPAFYAVLGNQVVFASAIKAITRHPDFSAEPNLATVRHYLSTLRLTFDNQTVFKGIFTVRPAEFLEGQGTQFQTHRYWRPSRGKKSTVDFANAVEQIHNELENATTIRLKSDVPVGMMMSGGVDSNIIAELARQKAGRLKGCCGGGIATKNDTNAANDFAHARSTASRLDFDYEEVKLDHRSYLDTTHELIGHLATPLATPTDVVIYRVAARLRKSVGVALGGEGADEAFCGYSVPHWSGYDFERAQHHCPSQTPHSDKILESLQKQYGRTQFHSAADHYLQTNGLIPLSAQQTLFLKETWAEADENQSVENYYNRMFAEAEVDEMADKYAHVLFRLNLESLLSRLDSATMSVGLEARVPYTDHKVVELAFSLPLRYRIDVSPHEKKPWLSSLELFQRGSIRAKRVLRSVASRLMPQPAAFRPKQSFPTPVASWLNNEWREEIATTVENSRFLKSIFQPQSLRLLPGLPPEAAMWNWPILNLAKWGDKVF